MSEILNKGGYVSYDGLLYDISHEPDAKNVAITVNSGDTKAAGSLEKGQIIDFDASAGTYSAHAASGNPTAILAEDIDFAEDDTAVIATVYITGTFKTKKIIASPALTDADVEALQNKGIFLK